MRGDVAEIGKRLQPMRGYVAEIGKRLQPMREDVAEIGKSQYESRYLEIMCTNRLVFILT